MLGFIFLFFRHDMINLTFIYIYISYPLRQYDFNGPSVLPCDACRRSSSCLPMAFEVILRVAKKIPEGTCSMEQITIRINYAVCYGMFIYIYCIWCGSCLLLPACRQRRVLVGLITHLAIYRYQQSEVRYWHMEMMWWKARPVSSWTWEFDLGHFLACMYRFELTFWIPKYLVLLFWRTSMLCDCARSRPPREAQYPISRSAPGQQWWQIGGIAAFARKIPSLCCSVPCLQSTMRTVRATKKHP